MSLLKEIKDSIAAGFSEVKSWMESQQGNAVVQAKGAEFTTKLQSIETRFGQLEKDHTTLQQTVSTITADKTRLEGELKTATDKVAELENTIKDPKGAIQQVAGQQAAEVLAQTGVTGALPIKPEANAAATNGGAKTVDELRTELKAATDPKVKSALATQIRELTTKKKKP